MGQHLFDLRTLSAPKIACSVGRTCSNVFPGHLGGVKFTRQFCSCRVIFLKASYSNTRTSNQAFNSVDQEKFAVANGSCQIFGGNGVCSIPFSRETRVLDAFEDEYEGIVVNSERLPSNSRAFASILQSSLSRWKREGKKGVWLKLPVEQSELVPIAVKQGFQYHHAEREYIMLTYWIPGGPGLLPANASHQVGVGGFALNDKNEVLVVQEKHCAPEFVGSWKLPTGFILESEEIFTGVVREVKEETGIDTQFEEVIAFRHAHNVAFRKSDLFFICMLRPLSTEIKVDDLEIQAAKWMPLTEFLRQPIIQGDSMFKKIIDICIARLKKRYCALAAHQVISKFDGKSSSLYYNVVEATDFNCLGG
ncbi:nudix hydrolase 8-like [Telopea speciosissima]|uniref:nudix hydrolase 8-like n=1 Tax=Telopea speciosissima TaxID=54955 RepID=UPI001CC3ED27|nr:nudix hydrolase 8-like [Telopea speciosissima]